jgi:hypothetical protein
VYPARGGDLSAAAPTPGGHMMAQRLLGALRFVERAAVLASSR